VILKKFWVDERHEALIIGRLPLGSG